MAGGRTGPADPWVAGGAGDGDSGGEALLVGEVRTALLQHAAPLAEPVARDVLRFLPGRQVRTSTRPIARAVSPDLAQGVHCRLPTVNGARAEGVGTVGHHATITGGRVVQGTSWAFLRRGDFDFRPPWSRYLARPGLVEVRGKASLPDVGAGILAVERVGAHSIADRGSLLDLGAVAGRDLDRVQRSLILDRRQPLRTQRTRVRFVVRGRTGADPGVPLEFVIEDETLRTISLTMGEIDPAGAVRLCEDLALHDWLLTTVRRLVESAGLGGGAGGDAVDRLRPAIEQLLHLWMPAAHVDDDHAAIWASLERRPGFSRQWSSLVGQIRDQLSLTMITLLNAGTPGARR